MSVRSNTHGCRAGHGRPGLRMPPAFMFLQKRSNMILAGKREQLQKPPLPLPCLETAHGSGWSAAGQDSEMDGPGLALSFSDLDISALFAGHSRARDSRADDLIPPPLNRSLPAYDLYGFAKHTAEVSLERYECWWNSYAEHQAHRLARWDDLLRTAGANLANPSGLPAKSPVLRRFVRKGVPPIYRGACWFYYCGAFRRKSDNLTLYQDLLRAQDKVRKIDAELIERDLYRSYPDNIHFKSQTGTFDQDGSIINALRRVLIAFSIHSKHTQGYCQSLNFIAGLLLLFMQEEDVFWMLLVITEDLLPAVHGPTLEGVNVDQAVLISYIQDSLPNMAKKLASCENSFEDGSTALPPITMVTVGWLMSLYTTVMPIETVLRIWDCLFYEGSHILFLVALTIIRLGQKSISTLRDPLEVFQVLQTLPKSMIDANALVENAFKHRPHNLTEKELAKRRKSTRDRLQTKA